MLPPLKYSTDERVVGEFVDGKPLYQKTFLTDTSVNNNNIDVGLISSNIDIVCSIIGVIKYTTGLSAILNRIGTQQQDAYVENNHLFIVNKNYAGKMIIIIQYTKTTDSATVLS